MYRNLAGQGERTALSRRSLLSMGALAALGACAPRGLSSAGAPARFDWTLRPPAEAGMSEAGIAAVRAAVQKQIDAGIIGGAVSAIARRGKLVHFEAQGFADPVAKTPMRKDAIFRVMSSSKPLTALAVLTLVDEGRISLDDRVSKYIPSFANPRVAVSPPGNTDPAKVKIVAADRELVIRDLLTHTSGITSGRGDPAAGPAGLVNTLEYRPDDTLESYIPRLGTAILQFQPGTKFSYSPTDALDTALYIVQFVSGMPADVYMHERIFAPLGMVDSYYHVPEAKRDRLVDIWSAKDGKFSKTPDILELLPPGMISGGGGIRSTVHDFMNFELMLLGEGSFNGRRILRPETLALMSRNAVGRLFADWLPSVTGNSGFGLAVRVAEEGNPSGRSVGGYGWGGAYGTESWVEPALDLAGVYFIQMNPAPFGASIDFENAARAAIVG
ncbi:serine hydrolase domain-containing protein [Sphingopyxis sp.]|jgi:CubicO group peptidase (beta-lactamase class C family)|uniref:serine hydrolase domain-containing protein n=1 Tax=Sphingopyxis sp. TaxID=1908224 RepID=UPI002DE6D12C|nr:serine hydrolase domain-containing protein [Sphingopyxis sp.]